VHTNLVCFCGSVAARPYPAHLLSQGRAAAVSVSALCRNVLLCLCCAAAAAVLSARLGCGKGGLSWGSEELLAESLQVGALQLLLLVSKYKLCVSLAHLNSTRALRRRSMRQQPMPVPVLVLKANGTYSAVDILAPCIYSCSVELLRQCSHRL
jgi:hypothetical protein